MTKTAYQRARSPEHKAERERAILYAAGRVLDRDGIEATTLTAIAREVGLAKSNIYRYFESREQILIRLLSAETEAVVARISAAFETIPARNDFPEMARRFAAVCADAPRFGLLASQMAPILERNISVEAIIAVKREFSRPTFQLVEAVGRAAPVLGPEACGQLVNDCFIFVAGLWPMAHPGGNAEAAMRDPEVSHFRHHFQPTLERHVLAMLRGLAAGARA